MHSPDRQPDLLIARPLSEVLTVHVNELQLFMGQGISPIVAINVTNLT